MIAALEAFHFLRPWWLLALLPAAALAYACLRGKAAGGGWERVIDRDLLDALMLPRATRQSDLPFGLLLAGWSLAVIGLAGPAWERLPEPVHRRGDALVVALDMGGSMLAGDLSPSRLARARFKLNDLLARRRDAYTALLVYAGDAHVALFV
jgi:Ca-activated chloride channel family protein